MAKSNGSLTLEGLAQILRDHMDGTATRFAEVGTWIDALRSEIGIVATVVRDLAQIVGRHDDEIAENRRESAELRQYIRQVFSRMEQQDAKIAEQNAKIAEQNSRIEGISRDIRRMLEALERRGGDGGSRQ